MDEENLQTSDRFLLVQDSPPPIVSKTVKLWYDDFSGKIYPPDASITNRRMHSSFSLHYVLDGEGWFSVGDEEKRRLKKGDLFFIYSRHLITYYPCEENPWRYCGISMDGTNAAVFFQRIGWADSCVVPASAVTEQIGRVIVELINRELRGCAMDYELLAGVYRIFAVLENAFQRQEPKSPAGQYVQQAKEYIENHYSNPELRLPDVSRALNLSHSYLCRIFREQMNCSADEYLIRFRMSVAARLLAETDYQISEIAFLCGYTDPSHFSRMYRKQYHIPPGKMRRG